MLHLDLYFFIHEGTKNKMTYNSEENTRFLPEEIND